MLWQDPIPAPEFSPITPAEAARLKGEALDSGVEPADWVWLAWSAATTYRDSDKRGGVNGARIRLEPQRSWEANDPERLVPLLKILERIRERFNTEATEGRGVSLADLIVLAGDAAVEEAARRGGVELEIPFAPGRSDATQEQTDVASFGWLEPVADGFRNFVKSGCEALPTERLLIDRAQQLRLTVPEMTVLVGGLRSLGALHRKTEIGMLTERSGVLSHDFFVELLDMGIEWRPAQEPGIFEGVDRADGRPRRRASRVDLVFGANSQLRAQAEYYAQADKAERFVRDFAAAWHKVMHLDRFDLRRG
jgi:catalase-peroxidase